MKRNSIIFWILLFFIFLTVYQTIIIHRLGWSWTVSFQDALISQSILGLFCWGLIKLFTYYQPGRTNRWNRLLIGIAFSFFDLMLLQFFLEYFFSGKSDYQVFIIQSLPTRFLFIFLLLSFFTLCLWIWQSQKDDAEWKLRKEESENLRNEAELIYLRQQIQPHFLFNSLNSISALVGIDQTGARKMIQQLSDFLRGTIRKDSQFISIREELEHLQLYLEIEKVRFGHRLSVEIDAEGTQLEEKIPTLLLQPIVENAIKFGLYGTAEMVDIQIELKRIGTLIQIQISNPFDNESHTETKGTGFGLTSIQRRLALMFHRNDLLKTEITQGKFITQLRIPMA